MMAPLFLFALLFTIVFPTPEKFDRKEKLSEYEFFSEPLSALNPREGVFPYTVNTPLFSNYSEKLRFFKLPVGAKVVYRDSGVFDFPLGTILIKNFYFSHDFRKPEKGRQLLETRLLVHETDGWQAYPYIWNSEQSEAYYDPAGETREVRYVNEAGKKVITPYIIPNRNQCKGCHLNGDDLLPLGPSARQLNAAVKNQNTTINQLKHWLQSDILENFSTDKPVPAGVVWNDDATGGLDARARAYLDANCGHCHSANGSDNTSGLFLDIYEDDPARLGVFKSPVAAGRGAGNMQFDIVPGEPDKSILVFRMRTNDPGVAMPEIGREQVHKEGVALIEEWIRKNTFSKSPHDAKGK